MKKPILALFAFMAVSSSYADVAQFSIDGKDYSYDLITKKEIGPGVTYNRIRIPDFPLNINYMTVDLSNQYNRIETQQANETLGTTEGLATAYNRHKEAGKKPLGGQNGNFWVVSGQAHFSGLCSGATYEGNLKNGQIITETNCYSDQWDGGPARTGVVGLDENKKLYIESMTWKGTVMSERWGDGQKPEIIQVNKFCRAAGEMTLYNSFYGRTKKFKTVDADLATLVDGKTCEVYLNIDENSGWAVGKDITAVVGEVKTDCEAGTLGDYDMCLAGTATYKSLLEQLKPGDKVTVNYGWTSIANGNTPNLENLIGGNAIVMKNGELTGRNEDEAYNSQVYSRSAYGMSEDGKTLYMFVIDKSIDPVYGASDGCNTSVMCQIMRQLGASNVLNVDAGGSAQLMVQGNIVNKTTEGTPRAVANGWMVYSVAPDDEASKTITRIEFSDVTLDIPVYTSYRPVVLGYNKYGELIDDDVEGVELSCDASLGSVNGGVFNAGGNAVSGALTANYGNLSVSKTLNVVSAELAIRLPKILIDSREYYIEIVAKNGFKDYLCDSSRLQWTISDDSVVEIVDGKLRGLKNGTATITGTLGDFSVTSEVTVELPASLTKPVFSDVDINDLELSQRGGNNLSMSKFGDGFKLTYEGASVRKPNITIDGKLQIWSLPESFRIKINPGDAPIEGVYISAKNALGESKTAWYMTEKTVPVNTETEYVMELSEWCDPEDVGIYPITLTTVRFEMGKSKTGKAYEIAVPVFEAVYKSNAEVDVVSGVSDVVRLYPNPVTGGVMNLIVPGTEGVADVEIFNNSGMKVFGGRYESLSGNIAVNVGDILPGIYYVKVTTADASSVCKAIIK